jgi:hypothetical protein
MREFLGQPEVMRLIGRLTSVDADADWHSLPGHGRFNLEADLLGRDGGEQPLASAQLLLPEQGIMRYGLDRRGAELYLHIALPLKDGAPVKRRIVEWGAWFTDALAVPGLLARFLEGVGTTTSGEPAVRSAVQIRAKVTAATGVDELIDFDGLAVLSPQRYSMQFDGWAVADQQGKTASAVSKRFLTELCESTGRTGYESFLAGLDGGTHQQDEGSEPTSGTP